MAATATRRRAPQSTTAPRALREWYAPSDGPALEIDRDARVIKGVRVLGRFSRNSHGAAGAENGTEYTPRCMESALRLYEGAEVLSGHETARRKNGGNDDLVGVLRNARVEGGCVRADLHYYESHPLTSRLIEDVERRIGALGLSHDATAARERIDPARKRLVVEELKTVRSVDLVRKPATNRNLWESAVPTLRKLIEGLKLPAGGAKLRTRLLEDDGLGDVMDAPAPEAGGDLKGALMAALTPLLDEAFESGDAGKVCSALNDFVKLHAKHAGGDATAVPEDDEDDPAELEEQVGDGSKNQKGQKGAMEALDAWPRKKESELEALRAEKGVRRLCESLSFAPTELQLESLVGLSDDKKRRTLIESFKGAGRRGPTSSAAPGKAGGGVLKGKSFLDKITG